MIRQLLTLAVAVGAPLGIIALQPAAFQIARSATIAPGAPATERSPEPSPSVAPQ